ncbi:fungal specific transcription factor [Fusarium longipes]|uniref:Fungal specific transcription factor n=1 Tax=Fusarium longipes TaxID=694270 RepID=A0A395T8E6_9HYPO|nr:fungal specific transcription factor [Fusarium longipes]
MEQQYSIQTPSDDSVQPHIIEFIKSFYSISDTFGETGKYVDMFTPDATFIVASKKASGHGEITTLREGMWDAVSSRKHTLDKVYSFGSGTNQVMLNGTVALELKNGGSAEIEWAGRMELEANDGKHRLKFYQVYLDTGAAAAYKK